MQNKEIMTSLDLITREDLEHFKTELFAELRKLGINSSTEQAGKKWLKSAEVILRNIQIMANYQVFALIVAIIICNLSYF